MKTKTTLRKARQIQCGLNNGDKTRIITDRQHQVLCRGRFAPQTKHDMTIIGYRGAPPCINQHVMTLEQKNMARDKRVFLKKGERDECKSFEEKHFTFAKI